MEEIKNEIVEFDESSIRERIVAVRGVQVMLDRDLAKLYGVETKYLKRQVNRNQERFPADFLIKLSEEDISGLRCQSGTSNRGGDRYGAYAFTEQGIAMLSGVLKSGRAIDVNIRIMRAFVSMRCLYVGAGDVVAQIDRLRQQQVVDQVRNNDRFELVFRALDRGNLLPNGIIPAGNEFDSLRMVTRLVESATAEIVLIDPYSDGATLEVLAKKRTGVKVRLVCKNRGQPTALEIEKFNRQYGGLTVDYTDSFHDRFLIIDDNELHGLGSSINSLGRRVTSYTTRDPSEIAKIRALL